MYISAAIYQKLFRFGMGVPGRALFHRPVFYGPAILLHVLKAIYSRKVVLGMIDQCHSEIELVN